MNDYIELISTTSVDNLKDDTNKYDGLSDEELKAIFEDWEADNAIEEYKSGLRE